MALGLGRGVDERAGDPRDELLLGRCDAQREHGVLDVGADLAKGDVGHPLRTPLEPVPVEGNVTGRHMVECSTNISEEPA